MTNFRSLLVVLMVVSGCTAVMEESKIDSVEGVASPKQRFLTETQYQQKIAQGNVSFHDQVKPILDNRCVVCHACYDAPCQLKLNSIEGVDRGATKQKVYDGDRLYAAPPTRLFIDAVATAHWREKGFYPVLNERRATAELNLNDSVLAKMLQLKRMNPLPEEQGKLGPEFKFGLNRNSECPKIEEFDQYKSKHPFWGMPYALPGLTLEQEYTVLKWLQQGAQSGPYPELSKHSEQAITQWEEFFNGSSLKEKLVARYIYEHLFLGHIHFNGGPVNEFFRLVRSSTPPGRAIEELDNIRPFSAPNSKTFYYRFRPIVSTIVDKTHLVYELNEDKMKRYQQLFFEPDYTVNELPSYQLKIAANPFETFRQIPRASRYKFMLDDAEYFVAGFIKGPVCRGQVALNVIRDRFWVAFLNPDLDKELKVTKEFDDFLAQQDLSLPAADGDTIGLLQFRQFDKLARNYLKKKDEFADHVFAEHGGLTLEAIWDGNGNNRNAALTVFRHDDSATVVKGWVGGTPLTAWVVDYPIFERIHYLLVAGFNVYGSVAHQLATRTYMDYLRMGSENNFLRFMPIEQRKVYYDSWYQGITGRMALFFNKPFYSSSYQTGIDFKTNDYKAEFFDLLRKQLDEAAGPVDNLNDCSTFRCVDNNASSESREVKAAMQKLASLKGRQLQLLPELSFIRVGNVDNGDDYAFTLIVNKALDNVAVMFLENMRRVPEKDTLTVMHGLVGSYPGFFFHVDINELDEFSDELVQARSKQEIDAFYAAYGVRRNSPAIWKEMDWFNAQHKKLLPIKSGLFDMNRYQNI